MRSDVQERAVDGLQAGCVETLITIVDFNSSLDRSAILEALKHDPTLVQLGVSEGRCDRSVRVLINRKILVPKGRPPFPPGGLSVKTKFGKLATAVCE
jgi:hypothetical protein